MHRRLVGGLLGRTHFKGLCGRLPFASAANGAISEGAGKECSFDQPAASKVPSATVAQAINAIAVSAIAKGGRVAEKPDGTENVRTGSVTRGLPHHAPTKRRTRRMAR